MTDNFYRAFEDRYRGSRETIRERLSVYKPFLDPMLKLETTPTAVDLGCGRGEWLEYICSLGFVARGVDLDEGMLGCCEELGLTTEKRDILDFLRSLDCSSLSMVSAFHVVEHIAFEELRFLVAEAHRVLKPGGLLIIETPNPENIVVGTRSFYLDPTHRQPIPFELLSFVAEHEGFDRTKVVRSQEPDTDPDPVGVTLTDVLYRVSFDYAVVAQKKAPAAAMTAFDGIFQTDFGISLDQITARFDDRITELQTEVQAVARLASEQLEKAKLANERFMAEAKKVDAMRSSASWKISAPLRAPGHILRAIKNSTTRKQVRALFRSMALYIAGRPRLRRTILSILNKFPGLKSRLVLLSQQQDEPPGCKVPSELAHLSPHARKIYFHLNNELGRQRKEEY